MRVSALSIVVLLTAGAGWSVGDDKNLELKAKAALAVAAASAPDKNERPTSIKYAKCDDHCKCDKMFDKCHCAESKCPCCGKGKKVETAPPPREKAKEWKIDAFLPELTIMLMWSGEPQNCPNGKCQLQAPTVIQSECPGGSCKVQPGESSGHYGIAPYKFAPRLPVVSGVPATQGLFNGQRPTPLKNLFKSVFGRRCR